MSSFATVNCAFIMFLIFLSCKHSFNPCMSHPILLAKALSTRSKHHHTYSVFKISSRPSHPMAIYLIATPTLTLLNSQSQQNAAET